MDLIERTSQGRVLCLAKDHLPHPHIDLPTLKMMDSSLDDQVLVALERNPYIAHRNLRFETEQGRVVLRGVVGTYFQKQMAQEALRHIHGISEIANELEVSWA